MGVIRMQNHRGDEIVAEFNPADVKTCQVAQDKLTAFLDKCIKDYGSEPPVYAKRIGETDWTPFHVVDRPLRRQQEVLGTDQLQSVDEVLLHMPLVGG